MGKAIKISKLHIRKYINAEKEMYIATGDKRCVLAVAILKGLYIAVGGEKGIPLSNNFDIVVRNSVQVFRYMLYIDNGMYEKAAKILNEELNVNIGIENVTSNADIACLLNSLIFQTGGYKEDILINSRDIERITVKYLGIIRN